MPTRELTDEHYAEAVRQATRILLEEHSKRGTVSIRAPQWAVWMFLFMNVATFAMVGVILGLVLWFWRALQG